MFVQEWVFDRRLFLVWSVPPAHNRDMTQAHPLGCAHVTEDAECRWSQASATAADVHRSRPADRRRTTNRKEEKRIYAY